MEYEITQASQEIGSITVKYSSAGVSLGEYVIDLPIEDSMYITGVALEAEIQSRAPTWLLERLGAVAAVTNFNEIVALVIPAVVPSIPNAAPEVFSVGVMP